MKALFSYLTPLISIAFTLVALFGVVVTQPSGINDPLAPGCMWSTDCELNGCEMGSLRMLTLEDELCQLKG